MATTKITQVKRKCTKCERMMDEKNFYSLKNGEKMELCKQCLTMHVNPLEPETFLWILEKVDVPYIEEEWNILVEKTYAIDPNKLKDGNIVLGKYLAKMRLGQWKRFTWADTEKIVQEKMQATKSRENIDKEFELELKNKYLNGEISKAEYKTLARVEEKMPESAPIVNAGVQVIYSSPGLGNIRSHMKTLGENDKDKAEPPQSQGYSPLVNPFDSCYIAEEELPDPAASLTQEDKIYLAMKWGRTYKPIEWVELEKKYNEMTSSFDIQDSDTIGSLILICKTYLKMNAAIDMGDFDTYQKLARTYDTLRKSAKFTAVQNKEEKSEFADTIGQLVAYCEKEGGKIPKFEIKTDLDIVDKVIKDLKEYNKSLIYEDATLARQIEDYMNKREISDSLKKEKSEAETAGRKYQLSDNDIADFHKMMGTFVEKNKEAFNEK